MADASDWHRLAHLVADEPEVWDAVRSALEGTDRRDPWEALLDGLDDAGALAYLRSDDSGMELADALAQLPQIVRTGPDLGRVNDTDDLVEATGTADGVLQAEGLRLVRLVEDATDSWPIVVLEQAVAAEVESLAARLGREAVLGG